MTSNWSKWSSPSSLAWKRPSTIKIPTIWQKFVGSPLKNGKIPKFIVQDITDELMEPVVQHMTENFLVDEPYSRHTGAKNDPHFVEQIQNVWRWVMSHRMAIVCLLENAEELNDPMLPFIAGCNLTFPIFPDSPDIITENTILNNFFDMVTKTLKLVDCFTKFDAPIIMYALGLSVDRRYRGQGIGEQLLRSRFPLARALGIKLTNVVFSGNFSQAAGRKAGYEAVGEIRPEDYLVDGKPVYLGVKDSKCMQLQVKVIPNE